MLLAEARAIEIQAHVVVCNRADLRMVETEFGGQSCIIDPTGRMIAAGGAGEALVAWAL